MGEGPETRRRKVRVFIADDHAGYRVCRRLRADASAPHTRVVLITGTPDRVIAAQAAEAGAVALLDKETPPSAICAELVAAGAGRVGWSIE
jgi:CheY-like chemotaxis protein